MSMWSGLGFQDSCGYILDNLIFFHDHVIVVLILVSIVVVYILVIGAYIKQYNSGAIEGHEIEFI